MDSISFGGALAASWVFPDKASEVTDRLRESMIEGRAFVPAGTAVELAAVASRDDDFYAAALTFLNEPFIHVEPVDTTQVAIAAEAWLTVLS